MAPRKQRVEKEAPVVSLAPPIAEGENRFGVAHLFASFNDTFVHITDLSGKFRKILFLITFCLMNENSHLGKSVEVFVGRSLF